MRSLVLTMALLALAPLNAFGEDPLRGLYDQADLVVVGKMKGASDALAMTDGVSNYLCHFDVTEVLKGDKELEKTQIRMAILQDFDRQLHHPLLAADKSSVFFLNHDERRFPSWVKAHEWLSIHYPTKGLIATLRSFGEKKEE